MKVNFIHRSGRQQLMHRRYADVLQKLGRGTYRTRDMKVSEDLEQSAEAVLAALRERYVEVVGRRPYHGWGEDELRERIAAHEENQDDE